MFCTNFHPEAMLAFFQSTQLNLFERFLTQARTGIDSTGITSGMQNVAYVVLVVGFSGRSINRPCTEGMSGDWAQVLSSMWSPRLL